jgi:hypothetical protein
VSDGKQLTSASREFVARCVFEIDRTFTRIAADLERAKHMRGDKSWRKDCLTAAQRKALSKATKRLRAAAKEWSK